ncbi:hypothetical protein [Haloimpatiens massiliensis]|uniref:hypothetical protein n=1 Tax=Haloimpatiens massiliensis TaxID=1658110 RepID=UPI000C861B32|nr:hypothetical protein [Haloimpatiens massiliensis]
MYWDYLYSILKMTREGKDTMPIQDERYRKAIVNSISIKDIEEMEAKEIKEAVINYLQVVAPEFK